MAPNTTRLVDFDLVTPISNPGADRLILSAIAA